MKYKILSDLNPHKLISIEIANIFLEVDEDPEILQTFVFKLSDIKGKTTLEVCDLKLNIEIKYDKV